MLFATPPRFRSPREFRYYSPTTTSPHSLMRLDSTRTPGLLPQLHRGPESPHPTITEPLAVAPNYFMSLDSTLIGASVPLATLPHRYLGHPVPQCPRGRRFYPTGPPARGAHPPSLSLPPILIPVAFRCYSPSSAIPWAPCEFRFYSGRVCHLPPLAVVGRVWTSFPLPHWLFLPGWLPSTPAAFPSPQPVSLLSTPSGCTLLPIPAPGAPLLPG